MTRSSVDGFHRPPGPEKNSTPRDRGSRLFVISGCSSSGKSTLLEALAARGERVVPEPGRRVVRAERAAGGHALPWADARAFMARCAALAFEDYDRHAGDGLRTFFDRSFIDVDAAVERTGLQAPDGLAAALRSRRYATTVFMSPPWPEIYRTDPERRHGFEEALAEYEVLVPTYRRHGYDVVVLPKAPVSERVAFVLDVVVRCAGEEVP